MEQASPYISASWAMTAALLLGGFVGHWLDGTLGGAPLFTLLGLLLGAAVGLYVVARVTLRARNRPKPSDGGSAEERAADRGGRRG